MLWRCSACNRQTDEPVCSRCQTPMEAGEPSDATALLKETCGSVLFLIAVICFTAALVFSVVYSWLPKEPIKPISADEVKSALADVEESTGIQLTPRVHKAITTLAEELGKDGVIDVNNVMEQSGESLPLFSILACIGLWLMLAQGYNSRVNFRKGGPICLKIVTIVYEVVSIIAVVCGALLLVGLWVGRPQLVVALNEQESDVFANAFSALLSSDVVMWGLIILCGLIVVAGILYTLFFIFATKTVNGILHTAKTGDFGKRASAFVGVMLCLASLGMLGDAVGSLLTKNWSGIASLLNGAAYLLFAITLFIYRSRAHDLKWEQPAFTGETAAAMPVIPAGIKASDLMNERPETPTAPVVPMTPATPVKTNPQQPRRTLNEPFVEESLEPKPMTANGCCPKCGTPIPDNAFFCLTCGHKLG